MAAVGAGGGTAVTPKKTNPDALNPGGFSVTSAANQPTVTVMGPGGPVQTPVNSSAIAASNASLNDPGALGVSGWNQGTTDPITGSIANYGYTPEGLAMLYDNPSLLAQDVLGRQGINNPGMAQQLGQYMDPAVAANFLINKGMGSSAGDAATMNFVNTYLQNMTTPNGRTPEFDYLMNQLLGTGAQSATGSPLGAYLNAGLTPDQQVKAANALMSQTEVGLNPYAQQAYSRAGDFFGQQYLGGVAKGQPGGSSYTNYLASTPLSQWVNR